jgi:mycothiol synthase
MGLPTPPSIPGVTWRPAVRRDAQAIADLQDACFATDAGYRETEAEIDERFDSPMADASTDSLVGVTDSGVMFMSLWSLIVPRPTTEVGVYDDNYIHPDHRTDDLRAFALDWWQARSMERALAFSTDGRGVDGSGHDGDSSSEARARQPTLPVRFHQHVYPNQGRHIDEITRRGFTPWLYFDELRCDLSAPVSNDVIPDGYEIVASGDVPALDLLTIRNDAFRDHRGSQPWTIELWTSQQAVMHRADASFAMLSGTEAVAFVQCAVYPHDAADRGYTEGWIEQIGTKRAHRGNGLAAALIRAAMRAFASDGIQYATLEVDTENPTGAHGIYTRLGFERVRGYVDYTRVVTG